MFKLNSKMFKICTSMTLPTIVLITPALVSLANRFGIQGDSRGPKGSTGGAGGRAGATAGREARTDLLTALSEARWGNRANLFGSEGIELLGFSISSFFSSFFPWGIYKINDF